MRVRPARPGEREAVLGVFEAALLAVDADAVDDWLADEGPSDRPPGAVLVAVAGDRPGDGRVVGALALGPVRSDGGRGGLESEAAPVGPEAEVRAVAVRPGRRGQGVGRALVLAAAARVEGALLARFDAGVRPFYEALGFDVEPASAPDRFRGVLAPE